MMSGAAAPLAEHLASRLRAAGFAAYLVGGCVRDLLLEIPPKDYDLATDATPAQVLQLFPKANLVGAHFGVVLVREGNAAVEIATFRSESDYQDGRHPEEVHFETDRQQDVRRRDFTINALLMDPVSREVLDFVGGQQDLQDGIIRAIGDPQIRFREDHLRLLRAVRFAARLGFLIEPGTMAAIQLLHASILQISAERIRDELVRILTEGAARRGFELLDESGLLADVLPEVAAMKGVDQPPEWHPEGDVWTHTLLMLEALPKGVSPTLAWGVLLHDVGKPPTFTVSDRIRFNQHAQVGAEMAAGILTRLRCSHEEVEQVQALVAQHMRFGDVPQMRESTLKRFLRLPRFEEHLELHRIDCMNSHSRLSIYDFVQEKLAETPVEELRPPRLLTGRDLIAAGYRPGPTFTHMLQAVEDAQLEHAIHTTEEALAYVKQQFPLP